MSTLSLVIGNKNTSTWSVRPWLVLKTVGADFAEEKVRMRQDDTKAQILKHSPAGKVPVLKVDGQLIWDTLAICEWAHETWPDAGLWPKDARARAVARSIVAEMHSGFQALRQNMPMDVLGLHEPGEGMTDEVAADIKRITDIWNMCRSEFGAGGDLLFGSFTIADAFFAPVVSRLTTYKVDLDPVSAAYVKAIWALPVVQDWKQGAAEEEGVSL